MQETLVGHHSHTVAQLFHMAPAKNFLLKQI